MKVAIIGGHMAPALGFISALPKNVEIVYIGREHVFEGDEGQSLEQKTISQLGIRFISITTGRVQRILTKQTLPSLLKVPQGFAGAFAILKKEKPDVVVGFGGYLSVPLGIAARMLRIPFVIHESTLEAGLANKLLAPFANKICISWDSSRAFFPKRKTVLTGNPFLPFSATTKDTPFSKSSEKLPLIVIVGGSGGSHLVNNTVFHILPELLDTARVLHLTGDAKEYNDYEKLLAEKEKLSPKKRDRYEVVKFIDPSSINSVFAKADLVVGRSGINTVAALLALRKKAVLIPLLFGQKDEQWKNAKLMESEKLATVILQKSLSPKTLFQAIQQELARKATDTAKWQIPLIKNGAENVAKVVLACVSTSQAEK